MTLFEYNASILPEITLIGSDSREVPHRNVSRTSEDYIYYLVTEGEMFFCEDGIEYRLTKGDCFLFEPNKHHYGLCDSVYSICFIHFKHPDIKMLQGEAKRGGLILPKLISSQGNVIFNEAVALIQKAIRRNYIPLENYKTLCACAVQEAFVNIAQLYIGSGKPERYTAAMQHVSDVIEYLNENYRRKLTSAVIENEVSYNFDYLNQLFKRQLDTTIFKMLEDIRMYNARDLLISSPLSIDAIAAEVGYKDETYFSKVFKKQHGISPMQFRKNETEWGRG